MDFYTSCYENALDYLIEEIGDREEQYAILVEGGNGRWGYPDDNDVSREMAISIAYAALQEYIGIEDVHNPGTSSNAIGGNTPLQ